jgi:vitamin B12 transporter
MRQILLAAGFLGGAMPALLAQTAPASPPVSVTAPPAAQAAAPGFSDSVVVTASLAPEQRDESPAAATVLDSAEIESRQAHNLADLLWSVPGVTVAQAGPPGQQTSVFIRGANSNQTLLLWNGIPLNDPYFGDINWQFVPTEGVERVEVVRGPYSALYGSNAVGGVVQVITGRRQGVLADLEGGGGGNVLGQVAAGSSFGPVHVDLTGHGQTSAGTINNDFFDGEEGVLRALWAVLPSTNTGVLLRANDSETGVPFSSGVPTPQTTISWQERELAVPFDYTAGPWLVNAQLSDTRFNSSFRSPDDPFGAYASDSRSQTLDGRAVGSYHVLQQPGQDLEVSLGTEGEGFRVSDVDTFGTNLDRAHQRTWAGFGEIRWGAGPVHLDAGLRRDDNDVFGGQTSLRAGGVWRLASHTLLRASYGQAFRAPTLGELYFPFSGNPNLRPETSTNYEVALEQTVGGFRFSVTGFASHQHNLIEFDNFTFMDINVDRARSRGLEGVIGYRQGIVRAELNGTLLNAVDETTDQELLRRPKGSANLILTLAPGDWNFNLAGRYEGRRADLDPVSDATTTNPGYVRLDVAGRWQALHWLAPYARIQNLANRHYDEVLGYPSLGRTLFGGVAVQL